VTDDDHADLYRSDQIRIEAPVGEVWSVLTDLPSWPSWMPDVRSVEAGGPFAPGTRFRWRTGAGVIRSEVLASEPGRSAVWRGRTLGIEAVHSWRLEDRDGASTLVETGESWSGFLPRVLPGYLGRTLAKTLSRTLVALKSESERRAGGSS
jgi:uncharacterized membrane protein